MRNFPETRAAWSRLKRNWADVPAGALVGEIIIVAARAITLAFGAVGVVAILSGTLSPAASIFAVSAMVTAWFQGKRS